MNSYKRTDNINGGKRDELISKQDVKKAYDTASGDEKKHLKKVLDGFDKTVKSAVNAGGEKDKGLIGQNAFGYLYG